MKEGCRAAPQKPNINDEHPDQSAFRLIVAPALISDGSGRMPGLVVGGVS